MIPASRRKTPASSRRAEMSPDAARGAGPGDSNCACLLKRRREMVRKPLPNCHGGAGAVDWVDVLGKPDIEGRRLRFLHDDVLDPGVSIGVHEHTEDEEYYLILEGNGIMTLNEDRVEVGAGDVTAVFPGGRHGLENTGNAPLRIIVISVSQ
jgi:mannose-6-phosphate isomerase-like protein (cupin superfamily)